MNYMNKKLLLISISSILTLALLIFFVVVSWEVFVKDKVSLPTAEETKQTCSEQNGNICLSSETCSGSWLDASDSEICCDGECITSIIDYEDSPFGIMAVFDSTTLTNINTSDTKHWAGDHFSNLGAKWSRGAGELITWVDMEPVLGQGYDWSRSDKALSDVFKNTEADFNYISWINPTRVPKGSRGSIDIDSSNEESFKNFVKAFVERYDGDGHYDYCDATNYNSACNPVIKVKYWQAEGEPFPHVWEDYGGTIDGYVRFVELLSQSAKEADPDAKIVLGACTVKTQEQADIFESLISKMKNKNLFEYADTHYWEDDYNIPVSYMKDILNSNGYPDVKIVSLEYGTYTGRSSSEKDQAFYLIKGYVSNLANGLSLINWNNLVEWDNYGGNPKSIYNYMGLIADGLNEDIVPAGTPRLSYHTYKLMVEKLEGSDWDNIQTIQESNNVYVYKFIKKDSGEPVWVVWWDYFDDTGSSKTISLDVGSISSVKITEAVPNAESGADLDENNYPDFFNTETKTASGGKVEITLGESPVFVEGKYFKVEN